MKKIIAAFFAIFSLTVSSIVSAANLNYAIIIDAGSSGSRLHLFQYLAKKHHPTEVPVIEDIFITKTSPGISSYANNPDAVGPAFKKILDEVQAELTARKIDVKNVSFSLFATAGMRLLPQEKQAVIYNKLTDYIKENYNFHINKIATISGKKEGWFGWLDINYLGNHFNSPNDTTVGSLDVGGASTQIAFSTNDFSKPKNEETFLIGGHRYTVFSKSFLGLGQDQARAEMNRGRLAAACYPVNYPLSETAKGSFDFAACTQNYHTVVEMHDVYKSIVTLPRISFIAYSGAYHDFHFFKVDEEGIGGKGKLGTNIRQECNKTWDLFQADHKGIDIKYLAAYCANGIYVHHLFYEAYQLFDSQVATKKEINGKEIDWTLGALLYSLIS